METTRNIKAKTNVDLKTSFSRPLFENELDEEKDLDIPLPPG